MRRDRQYQGHGAVRRRRRRGRASGFGCGREGRVARALDARPRGAGDNRPPGPVRGPPLDGRVRRMPCLGPARPEPRSGGAGRLGPRRRAPLRCGRDQGGGGGPGELDREMAAAAADAGAVLRLKCPVRRVESDRVVTGGPGAGEVGFGILIAADGPKGTVARSLGMARAPMHLAGAQADVVVPGPVETRYVEVHPNAAPEFFAWCIPVSDRIVRVGLCGEAGVHALFKPYLARWPGQVVHQVTGTIPLGTMPSTYGHRTLFVGDAAGLAKPTSGGGVYTGVRSGRYAAETAAACIEAGDVSDGALAAYEARWRADFGRELALGYRLQPRAAAGRARGDRPPPPGLRQPEGGPDDRRARGHGPTEQPPCPPLPDAGALACAADHHAPGDRRDPEPGRRAVRARRSTDLHGKVIQRSRDPPARLQDLLTGTPGRVPIRVHPDSRHGGPVPLRLGRILAGSGTRSRPAASTCSTGTFRTPAGPGSPGYVRDAGSRVARAMGEDGHGPALPGVQTWNASSFDRRCRAHAGTGQSSLVCMAITCEAPVLVARATHGGVPGGFK